MMIRMMMIMMIELVATSRQCLGMAGEEEGGSDGNDSDNDDNDEDYENDANDVNGGNAYDLLTMFGNGWRGGGRGESWGRQLEHRV